MLIAFETTLKDLLIVLLIFGELTLVAIKVNTLLEICNIVVTLEDVAPTTLLVNLVDEAIPEDVTDFNKFIDLIIKEEDDETASLLMLMCLVNLDTEVEVVFLVMFINLIILTLEPAVAIKIR